MSENQNEIEIRRFHQQIEIDGAVNKNATSKRHNNQQVQTITQSKAAANFTPLSNSR